MHKVLLFVVAAIAALIAMIVLHQVRRFLLCTEVDDAQESVVSPKLTYVPLLVGLLPVLALVVATLYPRIVGGGSRFLSHAIPYLSFLALLMQLVGAAAILRIKDAHDEVNISVTWGYLFLVAAGATGAIMTFAS